MRDKVYRRKAAQPSAFFADVYDALLLHILDWSCGPKDWTSRVDRQIGAEKGRVMGEQLAALLTALPRIPTEVFAYVVCSTAEFEAQAQVNDCSVVVMAALRQKKRLLATECCIVLFALAPFYAAANSSPVFEEAMGAAAESEQVLATLEAVVSGEDAAVQEAVERLATFRDGVLVLREKGEAEPQANVKRSGKFQMVSEAERRGELQQGRQARCLAGLRELDLSFVLLCVCRCGGKGLSGRQEAPGEPGLDAAVLRAAQRARQAAGDGTRRRARVP